MSNPTSVSPQQPNAGKGHKTATMYSCAQQEKLASLQGEVDLLLAQIQAETKLIVAR
jgi:hypothetical protein